MTTVEDHSQDEQRASLRDPGERRNWLAIGVGYVLFVVLTFWFCGLG